MNQWSRKNPRNSPPFGGQANHSTGCQRKKKTWRGLILILSVSLWGYGMAKPTEIHGSNMDLFCTKTWDFITYHCASCSICQFQRKKQLHLPSDTFAIEASERSKHRGRDVLEITCENMSSWPNTAEPVVLKGKKTQYPVYMWRSKFKTWGITNGFVNLFVSAPGNWTCADGKTPFLYSHGPWGRYLSLLNFDTDQPINIGLVPVGKPLFFFLLLVSSLQFPSTSGHVNEKIIEVGFSIAITRVITSPSLHWAHVWKSCISLLNAPQGFKIYLNLVLKDLETICLRCPRFTVCYLVLPHKKNRTTPSQLLADSSVTRAIPKGGRAPPLKQDTKPKVSVFKLFHGFLGVPGGIHISYGTVSNKHTIEIPWLSKGTLIFATWGVSDWDPHFGRKHFVFME